MQTKSLTKLTYNSWRKEYGGLLTELAKKLKILEKRKYLAEKLMVDLSLDRMILT